MKNVEFFNLLPEEIQVLRLRFGRDLTGEEITKQTGWDETIIKSNENAALIKIRQGLNNCGVIVNSQTLRVGLANGIIKLPNICEREFKEK